MRPRGLQAVPQDLAALGHTETAHLVSGEADGCTWPGPGPAVVRTADAPFTTRILVRRPTAAGRSSGNVVVEMLNPSNVFDLNMGWGLTHRQIVEHGLVWDSCSQVGAWVERNAVTNPFRYGRAPPLPTGTPHRRQACALAGERSRPGQ